jgi:hypothetical protein
LLFISGLFLLYSAVVVPFQICMWDYSDPCNLFPTLQLDLAVDTFFLVIFLAQKGGASELYCLLYAVLYVKIILVTQSTPSY